MKPRPRFLKALRESDLVLVGVLVLIAIAAAVGFGVALYPFVHYLLG